MEEEGLNIVLFNASAVPRHHMNLCTNTLNPSQENKRLEK